MKRPRPAPLSVLGPALVCGLCAGCTERQLISHPGFDDGVNSDGLDGGAPATTTFEPGEDTEGAANLGNFPEPAMTECGGLPAGVDPIPGLSTSWAVIGNTPGVGPEGEPYPDNQVRLRFSDFGAGCDETFAPVTESCVDAWTFAFSVSPQNLTPGVYEMAALPHLYPELEASMTVDDGCAGGEVGGGGANPGAESQGQLEIFTATDECVVGELRGLYDAYGDLDVDRNGGFVAMRCQSDCVPMLGNGCGE
jgi:hypothetical protein